MWWVAAAMRLVVVRAWLLWQGREHGAYLHPRSMNHLCSLPSNCEMGAKSSSSLNWRRHSPVQVGPGSTELTVTLVPLVSSARPRARFTWEALEAL